MMEWVVATAVLMAALWLMPMLVGAMKRRRRDAASIGVGSALLDIQKIVSPSTERLIEAQREASREKADQKETPDRP
ncbi:hypothetical protein A4249_00365 [Brevundimonas sp. GW460-12-10-14-LB2]|jgi:hypothetical protein|nr:hypothetical protein A4249_00365 [Brevundimonas sp. GW460-12-10-14-LB2]MEA3472779.1 hypothetical protein [Pseudomonadota bacterium]